MYILVAFFAFASPIQIAVYDSLGDCLEVGSALSAESVSRFTCIKE